MHNVMPEVFIPHQDEGLNVDGPMLPGFAHLEVALQGLAPSKFALCLLFHVLC